MDFLEIDIPRKVKLCVSVEGLCVRFDWQVIFREKPFFIECVLYSTINLPLMNNDAINNVHKLNVYHRKKKMWYFADWFSMLYIEFSMTDIRLKQSRTAVVKNIFHSLWIMLAARFDVLYIIKLWTSDIIHLSEALPKIDGRKFTHN